MNTATVFSVINQDQKPLACTIQDQDHATRSLYHSLATLPAQQWQQRDLQREDPRRRTTTIGLDDDKSKASEAAGHRTGWEE